MKVRNTRTGVILEMPEGFSGKYWEPVTEPAPKKEPKKPARKPAKK